MDKKKVSIILPVYDGQKHITNAINSILNQTYSNWELIIVNDCSTDNTLQIAEKFAQTDSRIKVYSNERNLKLPMTLNAGFRHATGDYFTWTSDDNMFKPEAIEVLVDYLEKNSNVSMVYSDYTDIDVDGNVLKEIRLWDAKYLVTGNVCGACFMYTAEAAARVGEYDANLFLAEDYDYWIRIARYGKVCHIDKNLYLYRKHDESLTETKKTSINLQTYKAIEKNFLFMYVWAKENNLQFQLFDHMMKRISGNEIAEIKRRLLSVNPGYKRHLFKKHVKARIRGSFYWHCLRRLKGILQKDG